MIIITGAAGFIGSCMLRKLNDENFRELVLVDDFSSADKQANYLGKTYREIVDRQEFWQWIKGKEQQIQFMIHLGARTDTTEMDVSIFDRLNVSYSQQVWKLCSRHHIPLIYASSAATYGSGAHGFADRHELTSLLRPLNPYGRSKNDFDQWVLNQTDAPFFWAGLKFFNVYGPNEYHKGRMGSVIFHAYQQILKTDQMRLFRSHRDDYADGEQKRDFIYVKDVVNVIFYLLNHRKNSGIYNLGTGKARSFNDLTKGVFQAMGKPALIEYIDTPEDIRDTYQYYTEAEMGKIHQIGYREDFTSLEAGIDDYVRNYLRIKEYY